MKYLAILLFLAFLPFAAIAGDMPPAGEGDVAAIKAEMNAAFESVSKIVNQPVKRLPREAAMKPSVFKPGWFHAGAIRPDFNKTDVRTTQQFPYKGKMFVTSDVTPKHMFLAEELEFNRMTKYFYLDRNLPKKKLSQPEMLEINRLYRIIGAAEDKLVQQKLPKTPPPEENFFFTIQGALVVLIALGFAGYYCFRKTRAQPPA